MGSETFELLRMFFHEYGYWTVAGALLLENMGLPVPGETTLLFASFLAFDEHHLKLPLIILVGIASATLGDNMGYWIGRRGGRPLLDRYQKLFRIPAKTIAKGERLFQSYGNLTVLFARFVFGLRVITGPLAGVLHMEWKRFALCNFIGASVWVTFIAVIGYFFGSQWDHMMAILRHVNTVLLVAAVAAFGVWYVRRKWLQRRGAVEGD